MANKLTPMPYAEIARHALSNCESLLSAWLPSGKRQGHEYKSTNPLRSDNKAGSFSININTGAWGDFATNDAGNDLISLFAYLEGFEQWEAAIIIADLIGFNLPDSCRPKVKNAKPRQAPVIDPSTVKQAKEPTISPWHPVTPVPTNAGEAPLAHPNRGLPAMKWAYNDANGQLLGYVLRFNTSDGGKETLPLTYCKNENTNKYDWRWMQWAEPNRPIYGLDRLTAKPDAYVLLVEGEKCADAPLDLIQGVPVSWSGGSKAIEKTNWQALAGRKIYAWADCDGQREKLTKAEKEAGVDPLTKPLLAEHEQPGMKAMLRIKELLLALDATTEFHLVDIPKPLDKPEGWDVADAINEGMSAEQLVAFITTVREEAGTSEENSKNSKSNSRANSADAENTDTTPEWNRFLLRKNGGEIVACLANVVDILENDVRWKGVIAFDEFGLRVVKLKKPPYWNDQGAAGEWDAQDDARTAMWITKLYRFSPSASMIAEAVEVMARNNTVNPPKDWLEGLKWDGSKRIDTWMLDYMGVPLTEYTKRAARWFFMGMVKRVFEPGCKFDYCLVLEGSQGRKKSSALAAIGGEWYGDTDLDLHNKDSMSALRGKMLYEFSELGSVAKAEATKQKSFLSRQVDEYRPVYGRREIRAPRQLVFTGTTNEWEWNKDPTGGRRFWPVSVNEEIDVEGLKLSRDQLFAEAVVMVKEGLRYWPTSKEQAEIFDKEQLARSIHDSYIDALYELVAVQIGDFTLYYAASEWLKIDAAKQTRDIQTRIGNALRQLGCTRIEKRSSSESRFWYRPPEKKLDMAMLAATNNTNNEVDDHVSF
jgi:predicted P-loop ATPase